MTWHKMIESRLFSPERYLNGGDEDESTPQLSTEWLTPKEIAARENERRSRQQREHPLQDALPNPPDASDLILPPARRTSPPNSPVQGQESDDDDEEDDDDADIAEDIRELARTIEEDFTMEMSDLSPPRVPVTPRPRTRTRSGRTIRPPQRFQDPDWTTYVQAFFTSADWDARNRASKVKRGFFASQFLSRMKWNWDSSQEQDLTMAVLLSRIKKDQEGYIDDVDPQLLYVKSKPADTYTWAEAMTSIDKDGYWEAAKIEVDTLEKMKAWDVVDRQSFMNVLPSTWAFRCKRFPDGSIKKLKARFCARGDKQLEGVDYFETFAPVVNWNTVRLMLTLTLVHKLETAQADFTAAFIHAEIDKDPNYDKMTLSEQERSGVYVEMPKGFKEEGKVLKLNRSLYGLKQSPRNFYLHTKAKLEKIGYVMSESDPCLFISDDTICLIYVDDTLFFSKNMTAIERDIQRLKDENMSLDMEDDFAGFLGVHIEQLEDGTTKLTQKGLIKRIVSALGVERMPTKETPAAFGTLPKDAEGEPAEELFNYSSVIGMLLYLSGH